MKFLSDDFFMSCCGIRRFFVTFLCCKCFFKKIFFNKFRFGFLNRYKAIRKDYINSKNEIKAEQTVVATLAHDLKTPIVACEKALYLMMSGRFGGVNEEQYNILKMCNNSLVFSKYLVGNMLCDYKFSQNYMSLNYEKFDCIEILKDCVKELRVFAEEKALNFVLVLPDLLYMFADKNELRRVFSNLIYNAIAYSYPKNNVEISIVCDKNEIIFYVRNFGNYIAQNQLNKIFNKNISLDNSFNKMGTGLGLYLSKEIIQAHGGEMIANSYPNNQNIFGFKLSNGDVLSSIKV